MIRSGIFLKPLGLPSSLRQNSVITTYVFPLRQHDYLHKATSTSSQPPKQTKQINQRLKDSASARTFIFSLDEKSRLMIWQELQTQEAENKTKGVGNGPPDSLNRSVLWKVIAFNAIPFIAFGFFDNFIMITAGNYIDVAVGVYLGITTLAAAGLGNLVSDVCGVATTGYVEALTSKMGLTVPRLTDEQANAWSTHAATGIGRTIGISIGCIIGMFPLLMMDTEGASKKKKKRRMVDKTKTKAEKNSETSTSS